MTRLHQLNRSNPVLGTEQAAPVNQAAQLGGTTRTGDTRDQLVRGGAPAGALSGEGNVVRTAALPGSDSALVKALRDPADPVYALYGMRPLTEVHAAIAQRSYPRAALVSLLDAQQKARGATSPAVFANIQKLADPKTSAVVTGQQVGVLGGPLYSLFKALGAVSQAAEMSRRGMPAVPVFWLASYDHDLKEVQEAKLVAGAPEAKLLSLGQGDQHRPVGGLPLGAGVTKLLAELEAGIPDSPAKPGLMETLRSIYRPEETFTGAFSKLVGKLTDEFGLVMVDPSDRAFAKLARPVIEKELFGSTTSQAAIDAASAQLQGLGHKVQVEAKTERLNVFFTDDDGRRVFLKRAEGGGFETGGRPSKLSAAEARALLDAAPERFTASALLRPVVEDSVIPTATYVGGPAEVSYFAQIGGVYDWAGVNKPTVAARPSFALVTQTEDRQVFARTGQSVEQLMAQPDANAIVGWSGLPEAAAKAYRGLAAQAAESSAFFPKLEAVLDQKAWPVAERMIKERQTAVNRALAEARSAAKSTGLDRCEKGLQHQGADIERAFGQLLEQLTQARANPGHTPGRGAYGKITSSLGSLVDQALKVGRQEAGDVMRTLNRLSPGNDPQERQMTIGQLFVEQGPGVAALLAGLAEPGRTGRTLVVLPERGGEP